jgi:phosphohistidine phosphatase SixA
MPHAGLTRGAVAALVVVAAATLAVPASAADPAIPLPGLAAVLAELRGGGLVIYFRHALTDTAGTSDDAAELGKCWTQRNLSPAGRAQATAIGAGFRRLRIPVGRITTSPFCRCVETAQLAFGRHTVNGDLYFAVGAEPYDIQRYTRSLRTMLSTPPAKGENRVIVSHTANLREAAGIWPKPEGVAYVFRPSSSGEFEVIAMILADEWSTVAPGTPPATAR